MRRVLKIAGIAVATIAVLTVLMTSVAMAGTGPNADPGTCPNPDCLCDGDQLQLQEQVRTCDGIEPPCQKQDGELYTWQHHKGTATMKQYQQNGQVD